MKHLQKSMILAAGVVFLFSSSSAFALGLLSSNVTTPPPDPSHVDAINMVKATASTDRVAHKAAVDRLVEIADKRVLNDKAASKASSQVMELKARDKGRNM